MNGRESPETRQVTARVGQQPHFAGTIHDDEKARVFGFRAALVPGISLYGFMASAAVGAWGVPWLERGTLQSRSRRPVYDGDRLTITAAAPRREGETLHMALTAHNTEGVEVASGAATLPDSPAAPPDIGEYPTRELPDPPERFAAGELTAGFRFGSGEVRITSELHRESLAYFQQDWPGYLADGIVHPTHLQRVVSRHTNASLALATPSIFVASAAQHYALARVGDTLTTAGIVTDSYERRGNHYYESDNVVIANHTTVIALIHRTAIYAARRAEAA